MEAEEKRLERDREMEEKLLVANVQSEKFSALVELEMLKFE